MLNLPTKSSWDQEWECDQGQVHREGRRGCEMEEVSRRENQWYTRRYEADLDDTPTADDFEGAENPHDFDSKDVEPRPPPEEPELKA